MYLRELMEHEQETLAGVYRFDPEGVEAKIIIRQKLFIIILNWLYLERN